MTLEVVERGARLLDASQPGWHHTIDIAQLDIACSTKCVLGQVYGGFYDGVQALDIIGQSQTFGFSAMPLADGITSAVLTEAWRDEVARRRLAEMPQPVVAETVDSRYC